jgi:hypothetical protein
MMLDELHQQERPIALQTSVIANQNRDPKKQKKPFMPEDYSYYIPREALNLPGHVYGSAAMVAINMNKFPSWALFCYKQLADGADPAYKPKDPILLAEDALLLHPIRTPNGIRGMLIALESAGGQTRQFEDLQGTKYTLEVPEVPTKAIAEEDVTLRYR